MKTTLLASILLILTTKAAASGSFHAAGAETLSVTLVSGPSSYEKASSDGLTRLTVDASCSQTVKRGIDVTLGWSVERGDVGALRVDVSELSEGFGVGRFVTSGEREKDMKAIAFEDALPGIYYYWRLLVKTPGGWVVGAAGRFDSPICPYDNDREEREPGEGQ